MIYEKLHICSQSNYPPESNYHPTTTLLPRISLDSNLSEIKPYLEDISFQKLVICNEIGRVLKILREWFYLNFFWKVSNLYFFLRFFSEFSKKLVNRAPVDGCCLCIEKTSKALNITWKISKEVHFLAKSEHFPITDHLHSRYLRMHFRWLLLEFATIFFIETFSVTVTKRNCYFGSKFCRILKKNITCRNFFQRYT